MRLLNTRRQTIKLTLQLRHTACQFLDQTIQKTIRKTLYRTKPVGYSIQQTYEQIHPTRVIPRTYFKDG